MRRAALGILLFTFGAAFAQDPVVPSTGPSKDNYVTLLDPSGTSNALLYVGQAASPMQRKSDCSNLGSTCIKRSNTTLTSVADSSNTSTVTCAAACGVWIGQRVTISGATVDTDLNGIYTVLTTPSSTTYTITTASVADATYNEATLQISTVQPLTTQEVWTITALKYDGSNLLIGTAYVIKSSATSNDICWRDCLAWSARATY